MQISLTIPSTRYGQIQVTAEIAPNDYVVTHVEDSSGRPYPGTIHADVLEEIETAIEFELQCARYDEMMRNADDLALASYYDA
ncbi:MAG: hypothetical protein AAFV01_09730 [Bacteroidota bacterium]